MFLEILFPPLAFIRAAEVFYISTGCLHRENSNVSKEPRELKIEFQM